MPMRWRLCNRIYFNPRSHERSDFLYQVLHLIHFISIHAPTRGATNAPSINIIGFFISIHAPTRGATIGLLNYNRLILFQSTLPREERHYFLLYCRLYTIFQSTLPREERQMEKLNEQQCKTFQSTLPREERLFLSTPQIVVFCISIHAPTRGATTSF